MIKVPDVMTMPQDGGMTWTARAKFAEGYRSERFKLMMSHLHRFGTAVEVGAHVGSWTIELSKSFDSVIAYEPNKQSFEILKQNILGFGSTKKIIPYNIALGSKQAQVFMSVGPKGPISSMIDVASGIPAAMTTLDSELHGKVDFLKIHCNGYELEVLRGAKELITRDHPDIFVVMKKNKLVKTFYADEVYQFLLELGYRVKYRQKPDWLFSYR